MLLLSCFKICLTEFDRFYQGHKFINRVRECLVTNSIAFLHHHHFFMPFCSRIKCDLQYLSYHMHHITSTTASLYAAGTYVIRIIIFTFLFKISILMLQSNLSTLLNISFSPILWLHLFLASYRNTHLKPQLISHMKTTSQFLFPPLTTSS